MPPNILVALSIAQAALKIGSDIFDLVQAATGDGRDLTPDELAKVFAKKQAADELAAAERARLDSLLPPR